MNRQKISLAIPNKGRLQEPAIRLLNSVNIRLFGSERQYFVESSDPTLQIIFARTSDIPIYVHFGAADLGITGHDLVLEREADVYELLDLNFGKCRLVVAVPEESRIFDLVDLPENVRIATEFPVLTKNFFDGIGKQVDIITVRGAAEIAPAIGLADTVVDLTSTGNTLKANGLLEIGTILSSSARLICNKISLRTKEALVSSFVKKVSVIIGGG